MSTGTITTTSTAPTYDQGCIDALVEQERLLRYERFGSTEAFELGAATVALAPEYNRGFSVTITRESDGLVLFSWSADDKAPRNVRFMEGKRLAAKGCGHASLYAYVEHAMNGAHEPWFDETTPEVPAGGAFPLRAGNDWVATISVSGLHEGQDHEVAVRALCATLGLAYGTDAPVFPGVPV